MDRSFLFARCKPCALAVVVGLWAFGCGSSEDGSGVLADPSAAQTAPEPPGKGDSYTWDGYSIQGPRVWNLIGNPYTPGNDTLDFTVTAPENVNYIGMWIDRTWVGRLAREGTTFTSSAPIDKLPAGEHEVLLAADGSRYAFARLEFKRSHPVYVFVSNDWDDPDNSDDKLTRQEQLHDKHPALKITHFVGPYTFTDPEVTAERAELLASWVRGMRDKYGDEIGLHIHPWCSFVDTSTVPCKAEPSFAYAKGDPSGYTTILSSYSREEMGTLLARAKEIFLQHGLGTPTTFRAGGWTTELHTLQALADQGFVADASAANWRRMEEWKDYPGASIYAWNQEHWTTIDDTSQPYYPSESDILESTSPVVPVLEVPDNGLLVDYVTADEMIEVFTKNWDGTPAQAPRMISIGYHPPNFSESFRVRVDTALTHIDQFLASADKGPVSYIILRDLPKIWTLAD